jgi:hypothetical protein
MISLDSKVSFFNILNGITNMGGNIIIVFSGTSINAKVIKNLHPG